MKICARHIDYGDGTRAVLLTSDPSWRLFDLIVQLIEQRFEGYWTVHLDGVEQRYWDVMIRGVLLTLHLDHYMGITLSLAPGTVGSTPGSSLLETIATYLRQTLEL
jgi:hypothetical protein